jgi:DNA-binding CsgD family transcriptional regulator
MDVNVQLTGRETQVLRLIARGCTYSQVADLLGVSAYTVGTHVTNLYRKLEVHSAAAAVMRAVELDLLSQ